MRGHWDPGFDLLKRSTYWLLAWFSETWQNPDIIRSSSYSYSHRISSSIDRTPKPQSCIIHCSFQSYQLSSATAFFLLLPHQQQQAAAAAACNSLPCGRNSACEHETVFFFYFLGASSIWMREKQAVVSSEERSRALLLLLLRSPMEWWWQVSQSTGNLLDHPIDLFDDDMKWYKLQWPACSGKSNWYFDWRNWIRDIKMCALSFLSLLIPPQMLEMWNLITLASFSISKSIKGKSGVSFQRYIYISKSDDEMRARSSYEHGHEEACRWWRTKSKLIVIHWTRRPLHESMTS